jgi:hypothetical protein
MDILFTQKVKYAVNDPIEIIRKRVKSIAEKRWDDFSENITGNFRENDTFSFTHKWSFVTIGAGGFGSSPAYLSGKLIQEGNGTRVEIKCRPNFVFIFSFYLITGLFLAELFGVDTFLVAPKNFILIFLPFFNLILLGIVQFLTKGLKNRFERLVILKQEKTAYNN